jgi:hypothetical protein|eukprot:COSAG02_NODE_279_length_25809_cov_21.674173_20_plen_71_part_00
MMQTVLDAGSTAHAEHLFDLVYWSIGPSRGMATRLGAESIAGRVSMAWSCSESYSVGYSRSSLIAKYSTS